MSYSRKVIESEQFTDGRKLVVYGFNGDVRSIPDDEYNSNIELFDKEGNLIWRVRAKGKSFSNFVGVNVLKNGIEAINFEGLVFRLDLSNGEVERIGWTK